MSDRLKLNFPLEQDEDGYPPFASEGVWAEDLGDGRLKIDSIPFYVQDLSADDIVEATPGPEGGLVYVRTIQPSSNSTLRVILYEEDAREQLLNSLRDLGCDYEIAVPTTLIAVNVPAAADVAQLLDLLSREADAEKIDFEESAPRYLPRKK